MDHESITFTVAADLFLLLLIGVGPKIALVPFLEITADMDDATKGRVARKMLTTAAIVSMLLLVLGEVLRRLLGSIGSLFHRRRRPDPRDHRHVHGSRPRRDSRRGARRQSRASSSAPWMNVDLRRRSTGRPSAYRPGAVDDAAVVAQVALRVEDRHVEPAVVRAEAGRPDDRADLAAAQVELEPRRRRARASARSARAAPTSASRRASRAHSSNVSSSRSILRSASANMLRSPPENSARPSRTAASRPTSSTPSAVERVEVERRALGRADQLRRRQPAGARQVVDLVVALVPDAGRVHPPQHVAAAIRPRQPHVLADRRASPAGPSGWISSASCTPVADAPTTSTPPSGSCVGIAVVERRELRDRRRHAPRAAPGRCGRLQAPLAMHDASGSGCSPSARRDAIAVVGRASPR